MADNEQKSDAYKVIEGLIKAADDAGLVKNSSIIEISADDYSHPYRRNVKIRELGGEIKKIIKQYEKYETGEKPWNLK